MAITTNGGAGITADAVATLTNKTLTAPVISDATFTGAQAGLEIKFGNNIVLEGTTDNAFEMTLSGGDPTADRTVTLPDATGQVVLRDTTDTLTNKTLTSPTLTTPALGTPASGTLTNTTGLPLTTGVTGTLPVANGGTGITSLGTGVATLLGTPSSANLASAITDETGSGALVFGTSPVLTTPILKSPEERLTVSATAATGTVNFDALTQGVLYYTTDASANWTLNVRGDGSTTLNDSLVTGDSITIVFLVTQGATAYYGSALTIDGSAITPKYITGTAFSAGNASSIDSYVYTIIKTGSATFTVLASQTKFA
jgi:hypothetical protein